MMGNDGTRSLVRDETPTMLHYCVVFSLLHAFKRRVVVMGLYQKRGEMRFQVERWG